MSHKANDIITDTIEDWVGYNEHDELVRAIADVERLEIECSELRSDIRAAFGFAYGCGRHSKKDEVMKAWDLYQESAVKRG